MQEAVVVFSRKESKFGELRKSDLIRAPSKVDAAVARSSPFVSEAAASECVSEKLPPLCRSLFEEGKTQCSLAPEYTWAWLKL